MANVEEFQNEAPLVTQRTGLLATSSNALARVREAIDQPGFRRAFPTLLATLTAVAAKPIAATMTRTASTSGYELGLLAAAGSLTIVPGAIVIYFVRNYIAKGFALGRV